MIASPLFKLTEGSPKPGSKIQWTTKQQVLFENLKEKLSTTVPLVHPLTFHPFVLDTDASGTNIGAVLQQDVVVEYTQGGFDHQNYAKELKMETCGQLPTSLGSSQKRNKTIQHKK